MWKKCGNASKITPNLNDSNEYSSLNVRTDGLGRLKDRQTCGRVFPVDSNDFPDTSL